MRMRRWPTWLLRTLIPVLLVGTLVGMAALQAIFILPGVALALVVVGCFMVLSDRRRHRDASDSVAYRAPGDGYADVGPNTQTRSRYSLWQWMLGDPPQDSTAPGHRLTPRQRAVDAVVTSVVAVVFCIGALALLVFLLVLVSVNGWWGTGDQVGPTVVMALCAVSLVAIGGLLRHARSHRVPKPDAVERLDG
jgi:hypothetical protein